MKYTVQEINNNINKLSDSLELLKKERTALSKQINETKKQIEHWESLDKSQLKMF